MDTHPSKSNSKSIEVLFLHEDPVLIPVIHQSSCSGAEGLWRSAGHREYPRRARSTLFGLALPLIRALGALIRLGHTASLHNRVSSVPCRSTDVRRHAE